MGINSFKVYYERKMDQVERGVITLEEVKAFIEGVFYATVDEALSDICLDYMENISNMIFERSK